jgi:Spy/CpxP family protein refolding chaperone
VPGVPSSHGDAYDLSDLDVSVDLDDLQLSPQQRDQLRQILEQEQRASDQAEQQIGGLSDGLRALLQNPDASESEIARIVDQITAAEGTYRKERILAWARARKVLNDQQRDELVKAARHHHGRHHAP